MKLLIGLVCVLGACAGCQMATPEEVASFNATQQGAQVGAGFDQAAAQPGFNAEPQGAQIGAAFPGVEATGWSAEPTGAKIGAAFPGR